MMIETPAAQTAARKNRSLAGTASKDTAARRARRRFTTVAVLVATWAGLSAAGILSDRGFPAIDATVQALGRLLSDGFAGRTIWSQIGDSLSRWGLGLLLAVVAGLLVGVAVGWSRWVAAIVRPAFEVLRYIPPIAWGPLAILWLGAGLQSQALVVFVAAFPPIVLNTEQAVRQVDPLLVQASRTLGARGLRPLIDVVLPSGTGTIVTGVRIACGNGWMALMGAELIGASSGLGYLILQSQNNNNSAEILVGMVTIGVIGLLIDIVMRFVERRIDPDQRKDAYRGR